jgi:hypothetical protein
MLYSSAFIARPSIKQAGKPFIVKIPEDLAGEWPGIREGLL